MPDRRSLVRDLQRELRELERDLRTQVEAGPELSAKLRSMHREAVECGRTAAGYEEWLDDQVTQSAVSWLLGCVFVRFCEDNRLVEPVWLAGPPERRAEAADAHTAYFHRHPKRNDRHWLLEAFEYLASLPPTAAVFDRRNPLWHIQPSGDAAERLIKFWRQTDADGDLVHRFDDERLDTHFLGDLYQDLSESARDRYAMLQTPEFIEGFILERTLERAIAEQGLEDLKVIDPACGSGHFLLGAFTRLLAHWHRAAPGLDSRERIQRVLDAIHGVDLNPAAIAIAKFRLTVAALIAGGERSLERAPHYEYHLATGDSLLHGTRQLTMDEYLDPTHDEDARLSGFTYTAEDLGRLREILRPGRYDVVVANPPYITARDPALNRAYRDRYRTCSGKYALTVPFCERLFELARRPDEHGRGAGWVGQITSNSFMKREFGKKLVEEFLARSVDLVEVVDTSGVYVPGHGTPTVILVGRNQGPCATEVRAVLGIRGEPSPPEDPARGLVWTSIVENVDTPGAQTEYVSVTDVPRTLLARHPWSLSGGGAVELKQRIEIASPRRLGRLVDGSIGFAGFTGLDDAFVMSHNKVRRLKLADVLARPLVLGESVRDWGIETDDFALTPYEDDQTLVPLDPTASWARHLWPLRAVSEGVVGFGGTTRGQAGEPWWSWYRWVGDRYAARWLIAFAEIATHNHFVLDRGGKVFNRTAPVVKLPADATEGDHLRLLGLLNSSTACFWLKQVCYPKGGDPTGQEGARVSANRWDDRYAFNATKLEQFPIPPHLPLERPRCLDALARQLQAATPRALCAAGVPTRPALDEARRRWEAVRARMIALQEELDWEVYRCYGLLDEDLTYPGGDLPGLALGERAFEIALARRMARGEERTAWFERHGSTPVTEPPGHWPPAYRELVERRLALIEERPDLALIERPECKRRWAVEPWERQEREALRSWLLDRLERPELWRDPQGRPTTRTAEELADALLHDPDFLSALGLYRGSRDYHLATELGALLEEEAVPFLAAYRYRESGLAKRRAWERVWELQRKEDAGEAVGEIPVPPKYVAADFVRPGYWQRRGKLDVPRERFISYPRAERDGRSRVYGWAGWDHLEQAIALATLALARRQRDGWPKERLVPLLAGLHELEPWLHQWHREPQPGYPVSPAAFVTAVLDQQLTELELTRADLAAWRPEPAPRGRRTGGTA